MPMETEHSESDVCCIIEYILYVVVRSFTSCSPATHWNRKMLKKETSSLESTGSANLLLFEWSHTTV